ncbi:MAG TPA: hypothetical protein VFE51_30705 [Verrucomicrobiae bacterium]|nr:hypothetical protein [Verrucomicrobiae bacterium]
MKPNPAAGDSGFRPGFISDLPARSAVKKSLPYEIAAAVLALVGAFILVAAYIPLLNPGMFKVETGRVGEPLGYYLVVTPFPVVILVASWLLNRKAQRIKHQEASDNPLA